MGGDLAAQDSQRAVFLSYASEDADSAQRMCAALRGAGIEVWLDQSELRGGDAWDATIRRQIKRCALFIPLISANTRARAEGYFRLEWKLAVDRSHLFASEKAFLLPVVIDATREADALVPERFREVQWTSCPSGNAPREFIERVARLLAPERPGQPSDHRSTAARDPSTPSRGGYNRRTVFIAGSLLALIAVAVIATVQFSKREVPIGLVAVLPFENASGDPAIDFLSDGISESLINKLSGLRGLHVIARTSAFAFKGQKLTPTDIGRKLGVDALLLGTLAEHGANVTVTAELVRVHDATQLWGDKYARRADDVLQIEGEIATTIARTLRRRLSVEDDARLARTETADPEAYRLYLKGRDLLVGTQKEMDKSIDFFQQAIARAPDYAMAHAGLADAYTVQAFLRASGRAEAAGKARTAVTRALELDPDLGEAHTALALVRELFDWDWAGAESEFRRGIELSPGSEAVHEAFGGFLNAMGRLDEGLAESREAARLDPLSVYPVHDMAINAMIRFDFDVAARGFRRAIDINPDWVWGYIKLARTLAMQKRCGQAFEQAEIGERHIAGGAAPLARSWLGITYALCGDSVRAHQKLAELHALEAKQYVDPSAFAAVLSAMGDLDAALEWFEKAVQDRSPSMVYARIEGRMMPQLGRSPRFQALIAKMGFPASGS